MCFTRYKSREKRVRKNINKVYPMKKYTPEFTMDEIIECAGCSNKYELEQIKIHCAGCNQFFHCKIAGTCYGKNCTHTINRNIHRLSYCINCVPNLPINKEKKNRKEKCICKECHN